MPIYRTGSGVFAVRIYHPGHSSGSLGGAADTAAFTGGGAYSRHAVLDRYGVSRVVPSRIAASQGEEVVELLAGVMTATALLHEAATSGAAELSAAVLSATALFYAATETGGAQVEAQALFATALLAATSVTGGARLDAALQAAASLLYSAAETGGAGLDAASATADALLYSASFESGALVDAAVLSAGALLYDAASISGGAGVDAALAIASALLYTADVSGEVGVEVEAGLLVATALMLNALVTSAQIRTARADVTGEGTLLARGTHIILYRPGMDWPPQIFCFTLGESVVAHGIPLVGVGYVIEEEEI